MTYNHLTNWCAVHNIVLQRDSNGARATAFDISQRVITTVIEVMKPVGKTKDAELEAAKLVCDSIAEELCLLKPSIVYKLNQS